MKPMFYPQVMQFETRRLELERELQLLSELRAARAGELAAAAGKAPPGRVPCGAESRLQAA